MFKVGDRIKVVANSCNHNYQIGRIYIVSYVNAMARSLTASDLNGRLGNNLIYADIELVLPNRADIESEIRSLTEQVRELEAKLDYLDENDLDECEENDFRAYRVLTLIEDQNMDKKEKLSIIAKYMKATA